MVRTIVINETKQAFTLKEGNAGVYRDIKVLAANQKHGIDLDTNATYREYVVVQNASGEKEYITSDDCLDNSTITVLMENDKLVFKKVPRDTPASGAPGEGEGEGEGQDPQAAHQGFVSRIMKMIFK